jgi:uncharacterized membrane protein
MKTRTTVLILLHLLVFNGLFVFRFPTMQEAVEQRTAWERGEFRGSAMDHVRLHFTTIVERNYYEWTTAVLGGQLEDDYPLFDRNRAEIEALVSETPRFRLPYREVFFEYPPVLMAPILAARAPTTTFWGFTRALAFVLSLAYVACLWVAYRIWQHFPERRRVSWHMVLAGSLTGVLCLGQIYVTRLDVIPSLVVLLAVWAFLTGRWYASAAWLAVGVLTKGYAIVLAPIFGLVLLRQGKYRALVVSAAIAVAILTVVNVGLGWVSQGEYWTSFRFHAERGIQIESLYALVPYLAHLLLGAAITVYDAHNSMNIDMAHIGLLLKASTVMPVVTMIALYVMFWRVLKSRSAEEIEPGQVVGMVLLLVFTFMLTFKVLSPQFLVWLTPLIYLSAPSRRSTLFFGCFLAIMLVTQLIWPGFYYLLEEAHPVGVALLVIRNVGLLALFVWLLRDWWRTYQPSVAS